MGFFKNKFNKNVTRDNEFLKSYSTKCNGLKFFTKENEKVTNEIIELQNCFQYTAATSSKAAKGIEKKIIKKFDELTKMLEQPAWDETQVILHIKSICRLVNDIASL